MQDKYKVEISIIPEQIGNEIRYEWFVTKNNKENLEYGMAKSTEEAFKQAVAACEQHIAQDKYDEEGELNDN